MGYFYYFNTPIKSGFTMSPQLIKRLSDVDGIIGVKESSGDLIQLQKIKQIKDPSFKIFMEGTRIIYLQLF
ncbi:dihydrodipicolinate synthase family protein [Compostibacillus humi]|uniref:dihydrodipicolinate synthase family protein n=1 Tax=Compostibacillus humi TaxID=1245525 RepID=UPI003570BEF3